jgi:hypothetical protein
MSENSRKFGNILNTFKFSATLHFLLTGSLVQSRAPVRAAYSCNDCRVIHDVPVVVPCLFGAILHMTRLI